MFFPRPFVVQEFVSEMTEAMVKLDRYIKDAVATIAKAADSQRGMFDESAAAEARAAQNGQEELMRIINDAVTSYK